MGASTNSSDGTFTSPVSVGLKLSKSILYAEDSDRDFRPAFSKALEVKQSAGLAIIALKNFIVEKWVSKGRKRISDNISTASGGGKLLLPISACSGYELCY